MKNENKETNEQHDLHSNSISEESNGVLIIKFLLCAAAVGYMKPQIKFVLNEVKRLEDDLWEVFTTYHWDNGTHTTKDVSRHSSKRLAEEQRTINNFKTLGL